MHEANPEKLPPVLDWAHLARDSGSFPVPSRAMLAAHECSAAHSSQPRADHVTAVTALFHFACSLPSTDARNTKPLCESDCLTYLLLPWMIHWDKTR
jgi:hypothetical protein